MLHVCALLEKEQVDLWGAQRDVLFDGDVQPTKGVCHAAWKAVESFTLLFPAPFKVFFFLLEWRLYVYIWTWNFSGTETEKGHRKYPLSKNDGEWWMELSKGSQWWNKTSSLLPLFLSSSRFLGWPVILHMVVAGLDEAIRNIWTKWSISDCYVAETLSCRACRFKKKILSQHHGCSSWRYQCSD